MTRLPFFIALLFMLLVPGSARAQLSPACDGNCPQFENCGVADAACSRYRSAAPGSRATRGGFGRRLSAYVRVVILIIDVAVGLGGVGVGVMFTRAENDLLIASIPEGDGVFCPGEEPVFEDVREGAVARLLRFHIVVA